MFYRIILLALWMNFSAQAVQNKDCEGLLGPASLSSLIDYLKEQEPNSIQKIQLQAWSNEYSEQDYRDVKKLIRSTYSVQMELSNINRQDSWVILDLTLQGKANLMQLLIVEMLELQEHLYWMKKS